MVVSGRLRGRGVSSIPGFHRIYNLGKKHQMERKGEVLGSSTR
jgi:hypothetical protein